MDMMLNGLIPVSILNWTTFDNFESGKLIVFRFDILQRKRTKKVADPVRAAVASKKMEKVLALVQLIIHPMAKISMAVHRFHQQQQMRAVKMAATTVAVQPAKVIKILKHTMMAAKAIMLTKSTKAIVIIIIIIRIVAAVLSAQAHNKCLLNVPYLHIFCQYILLGLVDYLPKCCDQLISFSYQIYE